MEYKYKKDLDKNIFRGYDIRGVYPTSIDEDTVYTFGLGILLGVMYEYSYSLVGCMVLHFCFNFFLNIS